MKSRNAVLVVLLLVAAAVGAALWLVLSGGEEVVPDAAPETTAVETSEATPEAPKPKRERRKRNTWARKGTGSVVGLLLEYGTDRPLPGVAMRLFAGTDGPNETLDSETDQNGQFRFAHVSNFQAWTLTADAPEPLEDLSLPGVGVVEDQETDLGRVYVTPGFEVPGLVVDEYGEPIPGATVRAIRTPAESRGMVDLLRLIREVPQEPVAVDSDKTDAEGKFSLKKVPPGEYEVIAFKPGYQMRVEREVFITPEVSDRPMRIVLAVGFQLEGRVVRKSEGSVEGLQVIAFPEPNGMDGFLTMDKRFATTDENGEFKLDGLKGGEYILAVAPEGEPFALKTNFDIPETSFLEVVLEGASWLEGYIRTADEKPIAKAQVYVLSDFNRDAPVVGTTSSDARGYYRLSGLKTGPLQAMIVQAEGFSPYPEDLIKMFGRGGGSAEVEIAEGANRHDITMVKGATVKGVVIDQGSDEPIEGARVSLLSAFTMFGGGRGDTTDADGKFELTSVPPGTAMLQVSKDGYYQPGMSPMSLAMAFGQAMQGGGAKQDSGKGSTIVVSEPEQVIEREMTLAKGSTLKGVVLNPDGEPVPGARIALVSDGQGFMGNISRLLGTAVPRITDGEGRFSIPGPAPGTNVKIVAKASQYLDGESETIKARPGEVLEGLEIRMRVGAVLTGNVKGSDGEPLAGALVRWIEQEENDWSVRWQLREAQPHRTDDGGNFRIANVETGKLIVQVQHGSHMSESVKDVSVGEGESKALTFELSKGLVLKGKVMGPDGRPRADARIDVDRRGDPPSGDVYFQPPRRIRSGPDGSFELTGLPAGDYELQASGDDAAPSPEVVVKAGGGTPIVLRLVKSYPISGVVRGEDGVGVQGVSITAFTVDADGNERRVDSEMSNADGSFEFENIPAGTYRLKTGQGWFGAGQRPNVRDSVVEGVEAGRTDLVIQVASGLAIKARVVLADGTEAGEGWVNAQRLDAKGKPGGDSKYAPVQLGGFELKGLDEGTYLVRVNCGGDQTDVMVEAGANSVTVDFGAGVIVRGRVTFADGSPAKGARVFANLKDGHRTRNATADADGRYELKAMAPGVWRVTANAVRTSGDGSMVVTETVGAQVGFIEEVAVGESGAIDGMDITLAAKVASDK